MAPIQTVILCSVIVLSWTGVFADSMCNLSSSNNAAKLSLIVSAGEQTRFRQPIREGMFVVHSIFVQPSNPRYRLAQPHSSLMDQAALVPESNTLVLTGIGIVGIVFLLFSRKVKACPTGGRL
jgi:hypothetical protein